MGIECARAVRLVDADESTGGRVRDNLQPVHRVAEVVSRAVLPRVCPLDPLDVVAQLGARFGARRVDGVIDEQLDAAEWAVVLTRRADARRADPRAGDVAARVHYRHSGVLGSPGDHVAGRVGLAANGEPQGRREARAQGERRVRRREHHLDRVATGCHRAGVAGHGEEETAADDGSLAPADDCHQSTQCHTLLLLTDASAANYHELADARLRPSRPNPFCAPSG